MLSNETMESIETGRAMVCGSYVIEDATDAFGNRNGLGVYVYDRRDDIVESLHLDKSTGMLEPVSLESAIAWCNAN